ncbi:uncharacterized protein LOC126841683 [Adelges cooleyi]|uniref:uncharacterized protein LOC126837012 n=1 Tax=Adelges cooleyi TaxID=133065 RepID=UPI00217FF1A9|nr:uncharacterized protein LOC126837012 [Adelges cooleyi]XP_050434232.1 uncharacterized protein LOC126841683 [Adelges cooleyi]
MIWKIIFLLSCFNVLVSASPPLQTPSSSRQIPFASLDDWAENLEVITITNWTTLQHELDDNQKNAAVEALKNSYCPILIEDDIVKNSDLSKWPARLKNTAGTGPNIDNIRTLTCRRIPGAPILYVGYSDTSNHSVNYPGMLFIFDSLVFDILVHQNFISENMEGIEDSN